MSITISISDIPKSPVLGYKCHNPSWAGFSHRPSGLLANPRASWRLSPMLRMSFLIPFIRESLYISSQMQYSLKSVCPFPRVSWTFPLLCSNSLWTSFHQISHLGGCDCLLACLSHLTVSRTETCLLKQEWDWLCFIHVSILGDLQTSGTK